MKWIIEIPDWWEPKGSEYLDNNSCQVVLANAKKAVEVDGVDRHVQVNGIKVKFYAVEV